jgi:hypothetical protein
MRLFAFILSLFVLTLSFVPCTDNETCEEHDTELGADHHDHEGDEDTCSPFCSCVCCGVQGIVVYTFHFSFIETEPITASACSNYVTSESNYFYSFWQPPKLR